MHLPDWFAGSFPRSTRRIFRPRRSDIMHALTPGKEAAAADGIFRTTRRHRLTRSAASRPVSPGKTDKMGWGCRLHVFLFREMVTKRAGSSLPLRLVTTRLSLGGFRGLPSHSREWLWPNFLISTFKHPMRLEFLSLQVPAARCIGGRGQAGNSAVAAYSEGTYAHSIALPGLV